MAITEAKTEAEKSEMASKDFLGLIGCLAYITIKTRPDCQFHVSRLSQGMANPSPAAYQAAIVVLSYLYRTRQLGITYGGKVRAPDVQCKPAIDEARLKANHGLHVWGDSSYGEERSHTGFCVMYMNAAICWASRRLKVIALSSTEAEVSAGVGACKDLKFVRGVLSFMWAETKERVPLFTDNEGMWFNVRNASVSARTRHWELWQQFVRECYLRLLITIHLVSTVAEVADILTKALPKDDYRFKKFRDFMMNIMN